MPQEPRYLFRRFVALTVDGLLVGLVAAALTVPFVLLRGTDQIRIGNSPFTITKCDQGENITEELLERAGAMPIGVKYCRSWVLGFVYNGATADMLMSQSQQGHWSKTTRVAVPVSDQAIPVQPSAPDVPLSAAIMVVASAAFLARPGRRTPGKALVGLRVVGLAGRSDALRREGARAMPILLLTLLTGLVGRFAPPSMSFEPLISAPTVWLVIGLGIAVLAFFIWYYFVPFFTGDRRARWDRMVGSKVTRNEWA